jgi:D-glycero-alpha-D-manno-heptose-7-phosphate kinase
MIISKTPFRVSFFGGGTDYPDWYRENGGVVLATAIDKYCYISCRYLPPFFEHRYRIVYSRIENVKTISEIEHPAVKAVLSYMGCSQGVEIHHDGDLPARSGLGSSSSFTVGLINVITALQGRQVSTEDIANKAIHIEQNVIKENVGSQDQISAAYGGFNTIEFRTDGAIDVRPVILPQERIRMLEGSLMLFFTGLSRLASDIAKSKIANIKKREAELRKMKEMVGEALEILQGPDERFEDFGKLLNESWIYKRRLSSKVTTPFIDQLYEAAIQAGATGGKILGAGGGGFLLLYVKPELQSKVKERLKDLIQVPFSFEYSGSRIVMYRPNGLS